MCKLTSNFKQSKPFDIDKLTCEESSEISNKWTNWVVNLRSKKEMYLY